MVDAGAPNPNDTPGPPPRGRTLRELVDVYVALKEANRRQELSDAMKEAFETMPGDRRFCVRRLDVVEHVARVRGIKVINNRVFRDIERAARDLGWESIKNGGRSLYRCVKHKEHDLDEALLVSRANRHDPRFGEAPQPESGSAD